MVALTTSCEASDGVELSLSRTATARMARDRLVYVEEKRVEEGREMLELQQRDVGERLHFYHGDIFTNDTRETGMSVQSRIIDTSTHSDTR